jgi:hypothetical protein
MWSEIVFQNLKEATRSLFPLKYSAKDLEYTLYSELKSDAYETYLKGFVDIGIDYPSISIEVCNPSRKVPILKNTPVTYDPHSNLFTVCRNHVHSLQTLRESFARENMVAYDHHILKRPLSQDPHALALTFLRGCSAELASGLNYSQGSRKSGPGAKRVRDMALAKCANIHLKYRAAHFIPTDS